MPRAAARSAAAHGAAAPTAAGSAAALIAAAAAALLAAAAVLAPAPARGAARAGPARILKGPYLQGVGARGVTVMWETDRAVAGEVVVRRPGAAEESVAAGPAALIHEVRVEGLLPSTRYRYRVRAGGAESAERSLATAALPDESYSFVAYGDNRTGHGEHAAVIERIAGEVVDFVVHTGDLVEAGRPELWQTFFDLTRDLVAETPLWPTVGNHETYGDPDLAFYRDFFSLPEHPPHPERYYAFTYANARFVMLDSNLTDVALSPQTAWLQETLEGAAADPQVEHVFVVLHHGPLATGPHGGHAGIREVWAPMFARYGVDVVFSGHDHTYERLEHDGVLYLVTGGGGAPLYPQSERPAPADAAASRRYERTHHYVRVQVTGDLVELTPTRADGTVIESMVLRPPGRRTIHAGPPAAGPAPAGDSEEAEGAARPAVPPAAAALPAMALAAARPRRTRAR